MVLSTLLRERPVVIDGGLASALESRGHDLSGRLWSARVLRDAPDEIVAVHRDYLDAGADVVITASYQVSRGGVVAEGGTAPLADELLRRSVSLARQAVTSHGRGLVAASVGPYGAVLHDGSEYRGRYGISRQALADFHRERLDVIAEAGPDVLAVETIPDVDEAEVLVELLDDYAIEAWITFSCAGDEHVCAGQSMSEAAQVAASSRVIVATGINCTPPQHVESLVSRAATCGLPVLAYPNAGRGWDAATGTWTGEGMTVFPSAVIGRWADAGARGIGGCCGIGSEGIAAIAAALH